MRRDILLGLLLASLARPALAQTTIFGTVHDQTGSPLPGVLVELSGPTSIARQTVTDDTGRYGATARVFTATASLGRCLQRARRARERHRLLLRLAAERRA